MSNYPKHISKKREPVKTPKSIVENGAVHYGTFNEPFEVLNLIDADNPFYNNVPKFLKKYRLAEWEAFEINMDEGILISAVYNMFPISFSIIWWYDKTEKKVIKWQNSSPVNGTHVAANLVNDDSYLKTKNSDFRIFNDFANGIASAQGYSIDKKLGKIDIDMHLTRISPLANCVMPLKYKKSGKNYCNALYSEKDFFAAEGSITINGQKYESNNNTVGIIDDHKGYYPFQSHYDWLTTMGKCNINGEMKYLALNLTHNQSVDQYNYNENVLWLEGESYPLPPVIFTHKDDDKRAKTWYIKDEYGDVDLRFEIDDTGYIIINLGLIKSDYALPFGKIYGYVKDHKGNKYILDEMDGIGEDKTTRF